MTYKGYEDVGRPQPPVHFRNAVTGEVISLQPGTQAVDLLRELRHPRVTHRQLWEQISATQAGHRDQ